MTKISDFGQKIKNSQKIFKNFLRILKFIFPSCPKRRFFVITPMRAKTSLSHNNSKINIKGAIPNENRTHITATGG
jgi:hypothetical protein